MAFHYQNLLQEHDLQYEGFREKYDFILEYTKEQLLHYYSTHRKVSMQALHDLAKTSIRTNGIFREQPFTLEKRQEKILVINNILFGTNLASIPQHIFSDNKTSLEDCYKLKDVLNELNPKNKDFLDGTMEGLVRFYLPCFNRVKMEMNIWKWDEFIIWRLMELLYLKPELVQNEYEKVKKRI